MTDEEKEHYEGLFGEESPESGGSSSSSKEEPREKLESLLKQSRSGEKTGESQSKRRRLTDEERE
eukprot:8937544-Karenia_brevis.AAC.1